MGVDKANSEQVQREAAGRQVPGSEGSSGGDPEAAGPGRSSDAPTGDEAEEAAEKGHA